MKMNLSSSARQAGSALFICLVLLVIMTMLVISGLSTTTIEEKITGNTQNKHNSFQAAEAALRRAEIILAADGTTSISEADFIDGTGGRYLRSEPGDADFPIWASDASINWQVAPMTGLNLSRDPEYVMELFGEAFRDNSCRLEVPLPAGCMVPVFRISARGWGANEHGQTLLQSTFRK